MEQYILICLIFFLAGFTQGASGFGSSLVAMPLLTLLISVKLAVPLCILNGLLITGFLSFRLKEHLDWLKILPLSLAALPGVVVGAIALKKANPEVMKIALGLLIIAYCLLRFLWNRPSGSKIHDYWGWFAGFASGVITAAISAGGPPVVIYTTMTGWRKDVVQSTLSGFFLLSGVAVAVSHVVSGITSAEVLRLVMLSAPFVLAGVFAGSAWYDRINTKMYLRLIFGLLMASGVLLIWSAV